MIELSLAVLVGICWIHTQAHLPSMTALIGGILPLLVVMLAYWIGMRRWHGPARWRAVVHRIGRGLMGVGLGVIVTGIAAHHALEQRLEESLDRASLWLDVVVQDLPTRHERGWRFEVRVQAARPSPDAPPLTRFPSKGVVHWYAHEHASLPQRLRPGDQWQFQARVRQPVGTLNPSGFDYEAWMLEKGLGFSATVQEGTRGWTPQWHGRRLGMQERIDDWRDQWRHRMDDALAQHPAVGVLTALVVGDQRAISAERWTLFQRTGVSHLMSISGLHVTMLAALFGWCGAMVWRGWCRSRFAVGLWIPVQSVRAVAAMIGAMGYALIAGFAVPAQRTAWMVSIIAIATILGIRASPWAVIAFALLVVMLMDPFAVLAPGFWLSFLAVAFLFALPMATPASAGTTRGQRLMAVAREATRAQLAITFGLLPVTVLLFQQIVVVGPLANAVAIPVVSFIVTPLAMVGVIESAVLSTALSLTLAAHAQIMIEQFLQWCAALPLAALDWPSPGWARAAIASAGMVVVFGRVLPVRWTRHRGWGWCGLAALIGVAPSPPAFGEMRVQVMDVGQGSGLVIQTHGHALLVDTGPAFSVMDAGARIVMPELRRLGIRRLDRLVLTHMDRDHAGGLASLLAMMTVQDILTPRPETVEDGLAVDGVSARPSLPPLHACAVGVQWHWDGVQFQVVHPAANRVRTKDTNRDSCVLQIRAANGGSLLVTGDIPMLAEAQILSRFVGLLDPEDPSAPHLVGAQLASQVLIAPHHGSKSSLAAEFLTAVAPQWIVVQAGFRNRFGHPHDQTLARVAEYAPSARVARTDWQGALTIEWPKGQPVITDFWARHRRYWHLLRPTS